MNLSNVDFDNMESFSGQLKQETLDKFKKLDYLDIHENKNQSKIL